MLRRKDNYVPDLLAYSGLVLNRSTYQLMYREELQALSGKEFQIMEMLMQRPGMLWRVRHDLQFAQKVYPGQHGFHYDCAYFDFYGYVYHGQSAIKPCHG